MKTLGIDIGGSAVKGALVDTKTGRFLAERHRIATPPRITPARMAKVVAEIAAHFKWRGPIGVGFPGVVAGNRIHTSANLHHGFVGCDGGRLFSRATGCPVALLNDAAAAALAEMRFGAGRRFEGKTLLVTLGTGIGTALAFRGVIYPLEMGHLPRDGKSWEQLASSAARERDDLSWKDWGRRVGKYLAVMEALLWPELIVVGGGVSAKHRKFFKFVRHRARMVPAQLLNQAGIVGAALWAAENRR
ncbi:MAG: ROK family protein [Verrucomicrobia bacterium]|nr:ROK family protein [Verrucomicrobiota bacterium]